MNTNVKNAYHAWAKKNGYTVTLPSHAFKPGQVSLTCRQGKYKLQIIFKQEDEMQLKWHRDENGDLPEGGVNGYDYPVYSGTEGQLLHYFNTGDIQLKQIGMVA